MFDIGRKREGKKRIIDDVEQRKTETHMPKDFQMSVWITHVANLCYPHSSAKGNRKINRMNICSIQTSYRDVPSPGWLVTEPRLSVSGD